MPRWATFHDGGLATMVAKGNALIHRHKRVKIRRGLAPLLSKLSWWGIDDNGLEGLLMLPIPPEGPRLNQYSASNALEYSLHPGLVSITAGQNDTRPVALDFEIRVGRHQPTKNRLLFIL